MLRVLKPLIALLVSSIMMARPAGAQSMQPFNGGTIAVPANQAWTDTGLDLLENWTLFVKMEGVATGNIPPAGDYEIWCHPSGATTSALDPFKPLPGTAYLAVIAKIGESGALFPVGEFGMFHIAAPGRLYLGVNDGTTGDNSGQFVAFIHLIPPPLSFGEVPVGSFDGGEIRLSTAIPNPSGGETELRFELPRSSSVVVEVFDVTGRRVRHLHHGDVSAGSHSVTWDGRDDEHRVTAPGTYYFRLRAGEQEVTRTVVRVS